MEQWQEQDLYIFFLPKYSLHLNYIEILWRKMNWAADGGIGG
ncbi:transposase [Catalinimonas alkaloidigena]